MKVSKALLSVSALASVLMLLVLAGSASAGTAPQAGISGGASGWDEKDARVRVTGRVDAIGDRGIALTTRRGQFRVLVNADTVVMVQSDGGCVQGTLRGVRVGGPAEVVGTTTRERGVILAAGIRQCRGADN